MEGIIGSDDGLLGARGPWMRREYLVVMLLDRRQVFLTKRVGRETQGRPLRGETGTPSTRLRRTASRLCRRSLTSDCLGME
jgi:hypothetical protein